MRDLVRELKSQAYATGHRAGCDVEETQRPVADLVIVSMHEKGFPQADFYYDASDYSGDEMEQMGLAPDGFFTMKRGDTLEQAMNAARERWPQAQITYAEDDGEETED